MSTGPTATVAETTEAPRHPLLSRNPTSFQSFEKLKAEWDRTISVEMQLGLLHALTQNSMFWWGEAREQTVIFLLELADGHRRSEHFRVETEQCAIEFRDFPHKLPCEYRRLVAEKAFHVLCLKFFKNGNNDEPLWHWMLENERVFAKVLWFFRLDHESFGSLYNFRRYDNCENYHKEIVVAFLREFAQTGWNFRDRCDNDPSFRHTRSMRDTTWPRLVLHRPQFIDLLDELDLLYWLIGRELDKASVKKLMDITLKRRLILPDQEFGDRGYRKPETLAEAVLGGSKAAHVLMLDGIYVSERKRLTDRYERSQQERDEKSRREELKHIQKEKDDLEKRERKLASK